MRKPLGLLAAAALIDAVVIWGVTSADVVVSIVPGWHTTFFTIVQIVLSTLLGLALLLVLIAADFRGAWNGGRG